MLPPNFTWDIIWTITFFVLVNIFGLIGGVVSFILIRESIKITISTLLGYEPLEVIAYGFRYDEITTHVTSNCTGCVEFEKFSDAVAVKD